MTEQYSTIIFHNILYIYHIFLSQSSVDGAWVVSMSWLLISSTAMNFGVHVFFRICFILGGYISRSGIAGS